MKICISAGHAKYVRGASGYPVPPELDEYNENCRVVDRVGEILRGIGVGCEVFKDTVSTSQNENLNRIVDWHNSHTRDYDVSVHFNAYDGSAKGTEVLYVSNAGETLATKVCAAIVAAGPFTNRGPKYRSDLFFLNSTDMPACLIETCFCDNGSDCNTYNSRFEQICQAIAESISGQQVPDEPGDRPDRPPIINWPPEFPPPDSEENKLEIVMMGYGDMLVNVNGQRFQVGDDPENCPKVAMGILAKGDVRVTINGQDMVRVIQKPTPPPSEPTKLHENIYATTFGGAADGENSAYPPYDYLNDTEYYVALPGRIDEQPRVTVRNKKTGKTCTGRLKDIGPWCTNDYYWDKGTRPAAETSYNEHSPLPDWSGTHAGEVAGNPAGIDLSPAMFKALGMTDNSEIDWAFEEDVPSS
jgi:N-acetylmuramoyl-L-alanine amidase